MPIQCWFWRRGVNLISFRDSLAHRIPLYIPPYVIDEAAAEQHKVLDGAAVAAALAGDQAEYDRLRDEQRALGRFRPWMTHSSPASILTLRTTQARPSLSTILAS